MWKRSWTGYGYETPPALSPDGSTLFVITRDNSTSGPPAVIPAIEPLTSQRHYYLKALSGSHGETLWLSEVPGSALGPSPSVNPRGDTVFATLGGGLLCAFSAKTGQKLWESSLQAQSSVSPVVSADGRVVLALSDTADFTAEDGKVLYAFDAVTGAELWHVSTPHVSAEHAPVVSPLLLPGHADDDQKAAAAAASARRAVVYVTAGFTDDDRGVYAYDMSEEGKGRLLWSYTKAPVELGQDGVSPDGSVLYTTTGSSDRGGSVGVVALEAESGTVLWASPVRSLSPPAVSADGALVYAGHPGDGGFFALEAGSGEKARLCGFKFGGRCTYR
jgi:outer membrane protein assembly factor BamB